jgi:hypothetical protein
MISQVEHTVNGYITPREECFMTGSTLLEAGREIERRAFNALHPSPNADSLAKMISQVRKDRHGKKVGLRDRICCYQWTWFTMTMVSHITTLYKAVHSQLYR